MTNHLTTNPCGKPYDLFSPAFKANPFPTFAQMREEAPVYAHIPPNGHTVWYVTRYEDVIAVLKDTTTFVKDFRHAGLAASTTHAPNMQDAINQNMLFSDPPDHTRLRALVNQVFTPRRMAQMAPTIQTIADTLLDSVDVQGHMDVIATFALPLPVIVICDMLGIPAADQTEVSDLSQSIIAPGRHRLSYRQRRRMVRQFVTYLRQLFEQRRQQPRDDLITALVQVEQAGDRLSEEELSSMVALLLVTGHETTVNLIGNGLLALLRHPEQLALLKAEPNLMPQAVEELLRFDGPVETSTTRWAAKDVTFRGQSIRRGEVVRVSLAAANRDSGYFDHPNQLDIRREFDQKHLAFGHGIHYCLGAPLARLEGQIALSTLLQRLSNLRLAVPIESLVWRKGVLFRGLEALPVSWD